jgi:ABC-type histidine transport system ATPase subunit
MAHWVAENRANGISTRSRVLPVGAPVRMGGKAGRLPGPAVRRTAGAGRDRPRLAIRPRLGLLDKTTRALDAGLVADARGMIMELAEGVRTILIASRQRSPEQ